MRNLLVRFFLAFWLIIGVTIGAAALAGYYYAERTRDLIENFADSDTLLEASQVLATGGRVGLADWLRERSDRDVTVYVIDRRGRDLLGRRLPRFARLMLHRHADSALHRPQSDRTSGNLRPARPLPQLVAPDGSILTFIAVPQRREHGQWIGQRAGPVFLLFALLASGAASYLLARNVSRPVQRLRDAALAIAQGDLGTRVTGSLGTRNDELGLLARDFDRMASELQQAAAQQRELSANISHELRSPLARLRVALELARRKAGDLEELARMESETERLDALIGQILRYARLDAADGERPVPVAPADLVEEVVDNVRFEANAAQAAPVRIEADLAQIEPLPLYPGALTSAVENILRNAVQHSPPGSAVRIRMSVQGEHIVICVSDAGPGVAESELDRLFEPFYRTRAARDTDRESGTGLGLAIAARATALHGGTLEARNVAEGGLQIELRLPSAGVA